MKDNDRYWDCLDQAMEASHGGRTEEALAWLDEALKAHPNGAEAHNGRGEILWDAGRIDEALYELELATMADPKFMTAHLNRIELLIEEMRRVRARAHSSATISSSGRAELPRPDRATEAEIHYLKAKALFYLDDLEGALFLVRRAGEGGARRRRCTAPSRARSCSRLARFEEARRALEQAVLMDSESAHAVYHLALVLERLGDEEEAPRAFRRANALDPEHYAVPVRVEDAVFERASDGRAREPAALDPRGGRERAAPDPRPARGGAPRGRRTSRRRCSASSSACRAPRPRSPSRRAT